MMINTMPAGIDLLSSTIVGMEHGGPTTVPAKLELTPFDLRLLLLDPIQKGLLFPKPESGILKKTLIRHLETSLSRALDFFPPLAGRLAAAVNPDDNTTVFSVDCNNAGAAFSHAVAGGVSVSDILNPTYIPKELVSSFFPLNGTPNYDGVSKPLLGFQVTELDDGIFIGCSANHAVVDGTSFWHFFNAWSEMSRGLDTVLKHPVYDRMFPTNVPLPPLEKRLWEGFAPPPLLERVFHFSKESIAKLKAKANAEAGTDRISSLQAVSAHLWRSSTRCRQHDGGKEEVSFMIVVGARGRSAVPDGYFGNAAYGVRFSIAKSELLQNGLGYSAMKINEFVAKQSNSTINKFMEDWVKKPVIHGKGTYSFFVTSSPRHNVYGADFGWGKPIAVRSGKGQKFDGKMTTFPSAAAGGIDVEVALAPEVLHAMEDDAEFMEAFGV